MNNGYVSLEVISHTCQDARRHSGRSVWPDRINPDANWPLCKNRTGNEAKRG
jgi:hypothetical protein